MKREKMPLLHQAVYNNKINTVSYLLDSGFDVNLRNREGLTALHIAAEFQRIDICALLIEKGADVNIDDNFGGTPLHYSYNDSTIDLNFILNLVSLGANINCVDFDGNNILHFLAEKETSNDLVLFRYTSHPDIGATKLENLDAENHILNIIEALVKNGANANYKNIHGETPLNFLQKNFTKNDNYYKVLKRIRELLKNKNTLTQYSPLNKKKIIEKVKAKLSRQKVRDDSSSIYIFTDNADRTSRPNATNENVDKDGWYYKKYKSKTDKPIHFGSENNPTSAVIRGLDNAYPISTMKAFKTNWKKVISNYSKLL